MQHLGFRWILAGKYMSQNACGFHTWHWLHTGLLCMHRCNCPGCKLQWSHSHHWHNTLAELQLKNIINNKVLSCSFKLCVTTCLALTIVAEERSVRADACNGPGGEGVFHNTLLFSKARVVNSTRVLASGVYACKLGATVSVDFTLWLINNSWRDRKKTFAFGGYSQFLSVKIILRSGVKQ